jgi:hypothetical protein
MHTLPHVQMLTRAHFSLSLSLSLSLSPSLHPFLQTHLALAVSLFAGFVCVFGLIVPLNVVTYIFQGDVRVHPKRDWSSLPYLVPSSSPILVLLLTLVAAIQLCPPTLTSCFSWWAGSRLTPRA